MADLNFPDYIDSDPIKSLALTWPVAARDSELSGSGGSTASLAVLPVAANSRAESTDCCQWTPGPRLLALPVQLEVWPAPVPLPVAAGASEPTTRRELLRLGRTGRT